VAAELTRRLAAAGKYELAVLGWGLDPARTEVAEDQPYRVYRPSATTWDPEHMDLVVQDFAPDVLITFGSHTALPQVSGLRFRKSLAWIAYVSIEAGPLSEPVKEELRDADVLVVPSEWCAGVANTCGSRQPAEVVPHAVCLDTFRSLPDRDRLRTEAGLDDRFVVGCVARNQFRKQIPILIKAFARFAEKHPDALLYLHTDPDDAGWPLLELVRRYGIEGRTAFTRGVSGSLGVDSEELNRIYNLFDVMVLPTMGEGFGLPILEAMAVGVPVVATDCSAVTGLLRGRGELIKVREWVTMTWDSAEYALADSDDLLARLEKLHCNPGLRREYAELGRSYAERQTWDESAQAWEELIDASAPAQIRGKGARKDSELSWQRSRSRVALVGPWNIACGVAEEMRILRQRALRPVLVFSELDPPGDYIGPDDGVIRCYRRNDREYEELFGRLLESEIDVVHVHFNHGLFDPAGLAHLLWRLRREGVRTVLTLHSTEAALRDLSSAADLTVVTTKAARDRLVEQGCNEDQIRVIPLPVRALPDRRSVRSGGATALAGRFDPTIVTTGFCLPHKGLTDLIRAVATLREDFPHIGILALCPVHPDSQESPKYLARCRRLVEECDLAGHVVFFSSFQTTDRVAEAASAADVLVFPYRHGASQDSSGALRMVMEADAPLVVTDIDLFSDLPTGTSARARPGDPESLAAVIKRVLRDPTLRRRLTDNKRLRNTAVGETTIARRHWCEAYRAFGGIPVHFEGTLDSYFSFAHVLRNMALTLDAAGCDVSVDRWSIARADHFVAPDRLRYLGARSPRGALTVRMSYPHDPTGIRGEIRTLMFPWEFTRVPEPLLAELADGPDYVLAVSTFVRDVLIASGLDERRVRLVQHGVDTDRFCPAGPRADIGALAERGWYSRPDLELTGTYRFLHLGHAQLRKGTDILLSAFCEEFSGNDDVCLVIKSYDMGDVSAWLDELEGDRRDLPRILYLYEDMPDDAVSSIYRACHALVHPSRGEGFGLPVLEAMACGLPSIVTGWGGHMDFCGSDTNYILGYDLAPVRGSEVRLPEDAQWAEPDQRHLRQLLRHVSDDQDEATEMGSRASIAARAWSWQRAGVQLLHATGMLSPS